MNFNKKVQSIIEDVANRILKLSTPGLIHRVLFNSTNRFVLLKHYDEVDWETGFFKGEPKLTCEVRKENGLIKTINLEITPKNPIVISYCVNEQNYRMLIAEQFNPRVGICYVVYLTKKDEGRFVVKKKRIWKS